MAETYDTVKPQPAPKDDADLLATARKRMQVAISALSQSRNDELDDLRFRAGSPDNQWQWPADVIATRGSVSGQSINARPCLTINKLPQHVLQVTNEQRKNRPSGKVIPVDDNADPEVAEILDGIVRHIEYISDADIAYDTACDNQVTFGEGYWRILAEYTNPMSFEQDLKIGRIRNSFAVYMDPAMQDPCGADAQWVLICEDVPKDEFKERWPDAIPVDSVERGAGDNWQNWYSSDTVRVAEYFYYETVKKTLCLHVSGAVTFKDSPECRARIAMADVIQDTRETTIPSVKWCKMTGAEILQRGDWPGKYIPVIRVVGNEFEIDGQIYISGLVRNAKDAQRMYNYWVSQEAEMLALAPKAPFVGAAGQFEGFEQDWKTANVQNHPYLQYNPVTEEGALVPAPQRMAPPLQQGGLIAAKMGAADDIKGTTGQYDPSLGAQSNETSGRAILAREKQSDTGTFHYQDNLARAIRYSTRQLVDLIPKYYDTQRVARIIGLDGEASTAIIDPKQPEAVREIRDEQGKLIKKIYNPSVGIYDVAVSVGPGYATKRQEAVEAMASLTQANPQLWGVIGDLLVKNMDWPGSEEMADRLKKTIPPKLLQNDHEGPDTETQLAQATHVIEALQAQNQAAEQAMQEIMSKVNDTKSMYERMKIEIDAYKAETERIKVEAPLMSPEAVQALVDQQVRSLLSSPDISGGGMMPPPMPMGAPQMQQMPQPPQPMPPQLGA